MDDRLIEKANQVDLLSLVNQYTEVKRVANTKGGEYAGPCPICGGEDRFKVQPHRIRGGVWFCRKCTGANWQDAIAFQMFVTGDSFTEAVQSLTDSSINSNIKKQSKTVQRKKDPAMLSNDWQDAAQSLLNYAKNNLFEIGIDEKLEWQRKDILTGEMISREMSPLEYLNSRGLNRSTIRLWDLGYIPKDFWVDPRRFGLSGKRIWIPQGILIPCKVGDLIWYLKIRRPSGRPKYIQVRGSHSALFMVQTSEFFDQAIICEGELDALLLWQEVEDLIGVISLGGTSCQIDYSIWGLYLIGIRQFFSLYDNDPAGKQGRKKLDHLVTSHIKIPKLNEQTKDLTDFYMAGGNIRELIKVHLNKSRAKKVNDKR